jgi:hypothetical protein
VAGASTTTVTGTDSLSCCWLSLLLRQLWLLLLLLQILRPLPMPLVQRSHAMMVRVPASGQALGKLNARLWLLCVKAIKPLSITIFFYSPFNTMAILIQGL